MFPFRVELGPPGYVILGGDGREISDRWAQQQQLARLVERIWNEAVAETGKRPAASGGRPTLGQAVAARRNGSAAGNERDASADEKRRA